MKWLLLMAAGALGTLARYSFSGIVYEAFGSRFPLGTLVVNLLGCFLVGFLASISETKFLLTPNMRTFLLIGFLGAFTTFSTFMLETANLIKDGQSWLAFWNVFLSVVVGFLIFRLGVLAGNMF